MRVLMPMPFSPVPPDFGGALRVYHVLKQLAARHEVSVVTYGQPEDAVRIRREFELKDVHVVAPLWKAQHRRAGQLFSTLTPHSFFQQSVVGPAFQDALRQLLSTHTYEVIHTEFSHLGPFQLPTRAWKVLDTHNVEYDNFRRMWEVSPLGVKKAHYGLEYLKMKRDELKWCSMQDAVLTTSERDKQLLDLELPNVPKFVVPNGVDSEYFASTAETPEPYTLVFTGMMAYVPNHDGITWFLDEVFPLILQRLPKAKLLVVGKSPPEAITARASENVVVTGSVPDVRPYVQRASAYVVPLRMGGGTRLKVAEALAMKKPMVTTAVGCEGIDVVDGESALIADTPQAFADAVVKLLGDAALRSRLAERGYQLMKNKYDWSVIGKALEEVYRSLPARPTS